MKATIDRPARPVPAREPQLDAIDPYYHRPSFDRNAPKRSWGPLLALVVAVLVAAAAAGLLPLISGAGSLVADTAGRPANDGGSNGHRADAPEQQRKTESLRVHDGKDQSRTDRQALVVDVGRSDGAAENAQPTSSSAEPPVEAEQPDSTAGGASVPAIPPSTAGALFVQQSTASAPSTTSAGSAAIATPAPTTSTSATRVTTSPPTEGPTSAGSVVWEEHFNSLNAARWKPEHSTYGDGNNELQCYQPGNVTVANGRLILTARSEQVRCPRGRDRSVSSGMVRSQGLTFSPGQAIEFRVKLTPENPGNQGGLWPAVWASSWAGSWPVGGELDFLEVMTAEDPRRSVFSLHYADSSGGHELQNKGVSMGDYFSDEWHVVRFDYGHGGNLKWYLDGQLVFAVSGANTTQGYPAPFDQTIREIKINLATGGNPGPLAAGALGSSGATFEVDYVRVFQL